MLFVPQVVTQTAEIARAIVRISLRDQDRDSVEVSAEVPDEASSKRTQRANRLSEEEYYALLDQSASPDAARRLQEFVKEVTEKHESLQVFVTSARLRLEIDT